MENASNIGGSAVTPESGSTRHNSATNRKVAIGAMIAGVVNLLKVLIQLVLLPVLGRLLGPDEFGVYALALPVITFVILLADGGLGASLAREEESSTKVWSSAFWALCAMGVALALLTTAFGFLLGYFANEPRLPAMIGLLSISLIFLTLSVIPSARLMRRKNLSIGAGADLAATATAAITAVVLAAHGAGAWSLVIQYVALNGIRSLILNFSAFHLPSFEFNYRILRPHLITGSTLVGSRMSEFAGRLAENLAANRIFGTAILGNYTFANQVSKFCSDAAANTIWGGLYVQALTGNKQEIVSLHQRLCRLLGLLLFPTTFLAAAAAPELVSLLLGPKWVDLPFFLRILLPLYAITAVCTQSGAILLAYGRFDIQFWCTLGLSIGRIAAVALGFWIGVEGAVYGVAFVTLVFCVAMLILPANVTGCQPLPMLAGLIRPVIASLIAVATFLSLNQLASTNIIWSAACMVFGFAVFVILILIIDRSAFMEDWKSVRQLMSRKKA
jgi:O-antigen/teichoic acid export membrane protein